MSDDLQINIKGESLTFDYAHKSTDCSAIGVSERFRRSFGSLPSTWTCSLNQEIMKLYNCSVSYNRMPQSLVHFSPVLAISDADTLPLQPFSLIGLHGTWTTWSGPNETRLQITINPEKTVLDLKRAIAEQTDVEAERQRLIYSGKVLKVRDLLLI